MPECEICETNVADIKNMARHRESKECRKISRLIKLSVETFELENTELKQRVKELETELKYQKDQTEAFRLIVQKAATRTTKTTHNTTNNSNTVNNVLQYLSSEPIDFDRLSTNLPKFVNSETVRKNPKRFADYVRKGVLEDINGQSKVLCTDSSRKNFAYIDKSKTGVVYDPMLVKLREDLRNAVPREFIERETREELDLQYPDPNDFQYWCRAFTAATRNMDFTEEFAKHMARTAYQKRQSIINFQDGSPSEESAQIIHPTF